VEGSVGEVSERVASSILLENERVRIWDDRAGPGETKQVHVHRNPYITVIIAGERGETVGEDGSVQRRFDDLTPGQAHYVGPDELPAIHAMRNTGSTELAVLIVELLP
jgi:oxalate decarboxylase/phosphoglucose isomerase-like protein (cupin superfamily)